LTVIRCKNCGFMIIKNSGGDWVRCLIAAPNLPVAICANGAKHIPEEN
jgi:hypothetical protein